MHFRIEPSRVVERSSFDEPYFRHNGNVRDNWRTALGTEVSINWLATGAAVVKRLELSLNRRPACSAMSIARSIAGCVMFLILVQSRERLPSSSQRTPPGTQLRRLYPRCAPFYF